METVEGFDWQLMNAIRPLFLLTVYMGTVILEYLGKDACGTYFSLPVTKLSGTGMAETVGNDE